jgi:transcriptional regulator with XRE-family HTH domain
MPDRHFLCKVKPELVHENYAQPVVAPCLPVRQGVQMENMSRIRELRNLTQSQLAEMVGANQATISKIEKGVGNPTLNMIQRIADALKCHPADLFDASDLRTRVLAAFEAIDDPARAEAAAVVLESMAGRK